MNFTFRDPHLNFNNYMVIGCLCSCPLQENKSYLGILFHFLLKPSATDCSTREDTLFKSLREAIPQPHPRTFPWNAWVFQENWYLID